MRAVVWLGEVPSGLYTAGKTILLLRNSSATQKWTSQESVLALLVASLVESCSMAWGLQGGIWPDFSPGRDPHSTVSGAVKAACEASGRVLKQPMGFMAHFGGDQGFLADCNKEKEIIFKSSLDTSLEHPAQDPV